MRLVLLGPPGVGKGVQGNLIKEKFNIPKISTGDILRDAIKNDTSEGREAEEYLHLGKLVPDSLINQIVKKRLPNQDCKNGFILDGYPRTLPQAEFLDEVFDEMDINLDKVVSIEVDEDVIVKRLSNRRVCLSCGEVYNMLNDPPGENGVCRSCGEKKIIQRDDDKPETIQKRFEVYNKETHPLKEFYRNNGLLAEVDGDGEVMEIFNNIVSLIE